MFHVTRKGETLINNNIFSLITVRKRRLGQVNTFTGVCLSTGGAWSQGFAWSWGVCLVWGVPGPGGGGWSGGSGPGGYLVETPPGTATAAGGTHPTGMYSCDFNCILCITKYVNYTQRKHLISKSFKNFFLFALRD